MASRGITDSTFAYKILVGPDRHEKDEKGGVRIYPGFTYRAQLQKFRCQTGKRRTRLVWIDGPVTVVKSIREAGEVITDYAADASRPAASSGDAQTRVSARSIDDDAWYAEVFDDPQLGQMYDKGHLIAAQFGGPTHSLNMAPQLRCANRRSRTDGRWNDIERQMRRMLEENDIVRSGGELRRRGKVENEASVELVKRAQGNLRVTLAYDDSRPERTIIPIDYCLHLRIEGASGLVAHAWNAVLSDIGTQQNMKRKEERALARKEAEKKGSPHGK